MNFCIKVLQKHSMNTNGYIGQGHDLQFDGPAENYEFGIHLSKHLLFATRKKIFAIDRCGVPQ